MLNILTNPILWFLLIFYEAIMQFFVIKEIGTVFLSVLVVAALKAGCVELKIKNNPTKS